MKRSISKALAALLFAASVASCEQAGTFMCDCAVPRFVIENGKTIRNSDGRALLLRGVNARIEGVFDVTFDDGREPLEPIPDFTAEDARQMAEWGMNFLRLPINWSGLEPKKDQFNAAYVARIREIVEICEAAGIYVLLDFHQDAWSKEIGEDGAPLWAIVPPPTELLEGPLHDLNERRTSKQVLDAMESFFENKENLQDEFAEAVRHIDQEFSGAPNVVGIEILNEPIVSGTDNTKLMPFYLKVIDHVNNPQTIWFFEPNVIRNQLDRMPLANEPFPRRNVVYAPHIYTDVFSLGAQNFASGDPAILKPSMERASEEAKAFEAPLLVGEFGIDPFGANAVTWYTTQIDLQNEFLAHSAFWVWKEDSQGSWGMFTAVSDGTWRPREWVVKAISSAYPAEVAGTLESVSFDRATTTATATVTLTQEDIVWAVPSRWYPDGAHAFCDGKPADPATLLPGLQETHCPVATRQITLRPKLVVTGSRLRFSPKNDEF